MSMLYKDVKNIFRFNPQYSTIPLFQLVRATPFRGPPKGELFGFGFFGMKVFQKGGDDPKNILAFFEDKTF